MRLVEDVSRAGTHQTPTRTRSIVEHFIAAVKSLLDEVGRTVQSGHVRRQLLYSLHEHTHQHV